MKLYTKEMFLIAAEKCEVSMIDAKHIMQYIDEYVTPIELPTDDKPMRYHCVPKEISDEEITKLANEHILYNNSKRQWIIEGMKLYKEQLKRGNNE